MHAVWSPPVPPHGGNAGWPAVPSAFGNMFPRHFDEHTNGMGGPSTPQRRPMRSRPPPPAPSQMQPQTLYSDDPAFSNDPAENPDFFQAPVREDVRITIPSRTPVEDGRPVQPPSYDEAVPGAGPTSPLSASSLYSESSPPSAIVPTRPGKDDVNSQGEQEELLAYLQDDWIDDTQEVHQARNTSSIPQVLRPGRSATAQPSDLPPQTFPQERAEERGRSIFPALIPPAMSRDIVRSATAPPTPSRPDVLNGPSGGIGRPQMQRRVHTGSPMRPSDLDRIDELDESVPMGAQFHMRGPYEVGKVDEPPARFTPGDRLQLQHQQASDCETSLIAGGLRQHILHAQDPLDIPPAPVPFKLHLKPGEFLTRVPSIVNRKPPVQLMPRPDPPALLHSQAPATQGASRTLRHGANELANPSFHLQNQEQQYEWTPEQLYHDQAILPQPPRQRPENAGQYPFSGPSFNSNPSSVNSSRTDLSIQIQRSNDHQVRGDFPALGQKRVGFAPDNQIIASGQSALSRSASTPVISKPGSFSSSTSTLARGPPPSDRHRPKQIVMPAPLQQQNPNQTFKTYTAPSTIMPPTKPLHPAAAVIPMHDTKKGNMLKKRASTNTQPQYIAPPPPPPAAPARKLSTSKGLFGFGSGGSNRNSVVLDESVPKTSRKLSKRRA